MDKKIKVGFCVAYDWYLLEHALHQVYSSADLICLSIDKARISWSGNEFAFDEVAFKHFVKKIDVQNKIQIYEGNFHLSELTPMQNEVRQRNLLAKFMGKNGWHIQLDCDEYFIGFEKFVQYLQKLPESKTRKANVCCACITLFKKVESGFLYVDPQVSKNIEFIQVAMREPFYEYGRRNGNFNIYTNFKLLHQSWARSEQEVKNKIENWGHSGDFDNVSYFNFWKSLSSANYQTVNNFHFLKPETWPTLRVIKKEVLTNMKDENALSDFPQFTNRALFFKNSKFFSRMRALRDILLRRN